MNRYLAQFTPPTLDLIMQNILPHISSKKITMAIAQHRRSEPSNMPWQTDSASPRSLPTPTMSNRIHQPLIFSIDQRFAEQHLTKLDLCSKNLKKIEKLSNNIQFNIILFDHNDITKIEHLDVCTHLIEVNVAFLPIVLNTFCFFVQLSISHNRLIDIRLLSRLRTLQKLNLSNNSLDSIDCKPTIFSHLIDNLRFIQV